MLMGPVFRAELLRTGRQRRYYVLRLVYGLVLLMLVWTPYEQLRWQQTVIRRGGRRAVRREQTFIAFAVVQLITVLLLVPAVFGGAIADEKQRKTLHYLMASQLSSRRDHPRQAAGPLGAPGGVPGDRAAGRVLARALWRDLGRVRRRRLRRDVLDRRLRGGADGPGLDLARRVARCGRDVLSPVAGLAAGPAAHPRLRLVHPARALLLDSNRSTTGCRTRARWRSGSRSWLGLPGPARGCRSTDFEEQFLLMVGLQLAGASLLLLLAIWRLRPAFRRQEETPARRRWFKSRKERRRRPRFLAHPECGDDPILWKERVLRPGRPLHPGRAPARHRLHHAAAGR